MKNLSLQNLEMVAAGRNWAWADTQIGKVPYPTAKAAKKILQHANDFATAAGLMSATYWMPKAKDGVQCALAPVAAYAGTYIVLSALEDNIDAAYAAAGLDSGSDH